MTVNTTSNDVCYCVIELFTYLVYQPSRRKKPCPFLEYIDEYVFGCVVVWLIVERKNIQKSESKHVIKFSAPDKFMTDELLWRN